MYVLDVSILLDVKLVNIFPHTIGCHFTLLMASFVLQKLFIFMKSHLLSILVCMLMIFWLESNLPCLWVQDYSPLYLLSVSMYLVFCWCLWSIWILFLFMVIGVNLFAFFYIHTVWPASFGLSSSVYFLFLYKKITCLYVFGFMSTKMAFQFLTTMLKI